MAKLDPRTERNLIGVHPDLVKIVKRAFAMHDDTLGKVPVITCGLRTMKEQIRLKAIGASKTLNSRHLPAGPKGYSHAVDVAFFVGGKLRWDWPLYKDFSDLMKRAAKELGIPITWGGDWRSFKDGPHFELPFAQYPK